MQFHGIKVSYNGKMNSVFYPPDWDVDYLVGEMLLDIFDTDDTLIEKIIKECMVFDVEINEEEFMHAIDYIKKQIEDISSCLVKSALLTSFCSSYYVYLSEKLHDNNRAISMLTINDLLDVCLEEFVRELNDFKWYFEAVISEMNGNSTEESKEIMEGFRQLFRERHTAQSFEYEVIIDPYTDEFMSVFTINSLLSLLAFEYSHLKENGIHIKQCKNCGRYFIPENRSDTIYCHWPSPQDQLRTCRQIGAQIAMMNRINGEETVKAYRKKYQSLNMAYQREVDESLKQRHFNRREQFKNIGKTKKKELKAGSITSEEFIEWCTHFV